MGDEEAEMGWGSDVEPCEEGEGCLDLLFAECPCFHPGEVEEVGRAQGGKGGGLLPSLIYRLLECVFVNFD